MHRLMYPLAVSACMYSICSCVHALQPTNLPLFLLSNQPTYLSSCSHAGGATSTRGTPSKLNKLVRKASSVVGVELVRLEVVAERGMRRKLAAGHQGVRKTYARALRHCFWPRLKRDVSAYIITCHTCQLTGKPSQTIKPAPLSPRVCHVNLLKPYYSCQSKGEYIAKFNCPLTGFSFLRRNS